MTKQGIQISLAIIYLTIAIFLFEAVAAEPQLIEVEKGIYQDSKTGLMWQTGRSRSFTNKNDAARFVEDLTLGGHSDWRLPTLEERLNLKNTFDLKRNGSCTLKRLDGSYWTAETKMKTQPGRLEPNNECGGGYDFILKSKGYVRAVRP